MPCADPIDAFRPARGGPLLFKPPKDGHYYTAIKVPCGYCILCRQEQARQWAVRITHEASLHDKNSFITLTYNDENLPEHNSLNYRDLQLFWKRLRKALEPNKIRFYAVGEYGDHTLRPHYHACVFGENFVTSRLIIRTEPSILWTSPLLQEAWGKGHVSVGALNLQTASYTASYVIKKLRQKQQYVRIDQETGELIPLVQPRAFMSRGGRHGRGIGYHWYEKYGKQTYEHDHVIMSGSRAKPPKYYDNQLQKEDESKYQNIKANRTAKLETSTPERLHARARNAHARAKLKGSTI